MIRKYWAVFSYSLKNRIAYLPAFAFRNIFFLIILYIFSKLWGVIYKEASTIEGLGIEQTLWYLAFTEAIELGKVRIFEEIQTEVKDGSIAYSIGRPYSYVCFMFFRGYGATITQMLPLLLLGGGFASILTGPLGNIPILPGIVVLLGGAALSMLWMILIGLLAFWFEEVTPFYWLFQKMVFIIGGMFIPIDFFPRWLQGFSKSSPFAFSAYWPAIVIVDFSWERFLLAVTGQLGYGIVLFTAISLLFTTVRKRLHVQGG